jgi:hypothetical protein
MRRMQHRLDTEFVDLLDWHAFSLEEVRAAVARRVGGTIEVVPSHWETRAFFGLTMGYTSPSGPHWLIVYEQDAVAEHHLMIVLHELMHIVLGHRVATLTADELRQELLRLGLISLVGLSGEAITYARTCAPPGDRGEAVDSDREEAEAELGAAWIMSRARSAGRLPPSGQVFSPEHIALSRLLGDADGQ